ncbi:MAG: PstS family phosphate ABC transporter substrate-binding protein [Thermoflexaceae bacterium]|nr:PstS family phosphate ABC transporter substrate-binding protein [Thermoflexaceae bacterium]
MAALRRPRGRQRLILLVLAALSPLAGIACGDNGGDGPAEVPTNASGIDYTRLRGKVRVDGSSTVYPISEAVAEEFSKVARGVKVNVAFSGTGGGFEKFCRGDIQVSAASRPIKASEKQACEENSITDIVELQVAIDALTVVVSPQNTWATCMTTDELNFAFRSGGAKKWSDIRPEWPDASIKVYYPGPDSGTFDYFREAILTGVDRESTHRTDGTPSEDDNVLALGIENDRHAIGYFGFAYFEEAGKHLKAVEVDGGHGCVEPAFDNALRGAYVPLSRPLFIYTRESLLRERPELLGFTQFYLDNIEALVKEVGYINMPGELLQQQHDRLKPFLPQ